MSSLLALSQLSFQTCDRTFFSFSSNTSFNKKYNHSAQFIDVYCDISQNPCSVKNRTAQKLAGSSSRLSRLQCKLTMVKPFFTIWSILDIPQTLTPFHKLTILPEMNAEKLIAIKTTKKISKRTKPEVFEISTKHYFR